MFRMSEINNSPDDRCWLGRSKPLQVVTIFSNKRKEDIFHSDPSILQFHSLDPEQNLVEQWDFFNLTELKPDLILTKISKFLLVNLANESGNTETCCKTSYLRKLWKEKKETFNRLEILPLESQMLLGDRSKMHCFIKTVCNAVNFTKNCNKNIEQDLRINNSQIPPVCRHPVSFKISSSVNIFDKEVVSDLPSFPLIVKPICTENKNMAIVTNLKSLQHYRRTISSTVVVEEYIPHNNTILKVGLIGKNIFVVRRPSIPNLLEHNRESLMKLSTDIKGEFVALDTEAGGYVTFQSTTTKRKECYSSNKLDECTDIDRDTVKLVVDIISCILKLKLLGVDILISNQDQSMYIVDINVFPGFKNIQDKEKLLTNFLLEEATKKAFQHDCNNLTSSDVLKLCLMHNEKWKQNNLTTEDLILRCVTRNRIFVVNIKENVKVDFTLYPALLKFRNLKTPKRFLYNKNSFSANISKNLSKLGLGPNHVKLISAFYYGKSKIVGTMREWVDGLPLQHYLQQEECLDKLERVFENIGKNIADFHLLMENKEFHKNVIDYHYPGESQEIPTVFRLIKQWREDALVALLPSNILNTTWSGFYDNIITSSKNLNHITKDIFDSLQTKQATSLVFGHLDCNTSNIIVVGPLNYAKTFLIDEEWAGPNVAVYDIAKLISSILLMVTRKTTLLKISILKELIYILVRSYLQNVMKRTNYSCNNDKNNEADKELCKKLSNDAWKLFPYVALVNCYSNIIHASKEGQLKEIINDTGLKRKSDGNFNWLRHASDHFSLFNEYYKNNLSSD